MRIAHRLQTGPGTVLGLQSGGGKFSGMTRNKPALIWRSPAGGYRRFVESKSNVRVRIAAVRQVVNYVYWRPRSVLQPVGDDIHQLAQVEVCGIKRDVNIAPDL